MTYSRTLSLTVIGALLGAGPLTSAVFGHDRTDVIRCFETERRELEEQIRHERRSIVSQADHDRRRLVASRSELVRRRPPGWREGMIDLNYRQRQIDARMSASLQRLELAARQRRDEWRRARDQALRADGDRFYRPPRMFER